MTDKLELDEVVVLDVSDDALELAAGRAQGERQLLDDSNAGYDRNVY